MDPEITNPKSNLEVWPILSLHAQHVEIGSEQCRNFHTEILRPESLDDADVHRLCGAAYLALSLSGRLAGTCALRLHHRWLRKLLTAIDVVITRHSLFLEPLAKRLIQIVHGRCASESPSPEGHLAVPRDYDRIGVTESPLL